MSSAAKTTLISYVKPPTNYPKEKITVCLQEQDGNDQKFSADPTILCENSQIFSQLLQQNACQNGKRTVSVTDVKHHILKNMLQFMHSGEHELSSVKDVLDLLSAALKFQVVSLIEECQTILSCKMNLENVCHFYALSRTARPFLQCLEELSVALILRAFPVLVRSPSFNNLPLEFKREILMDDRLCIENETWLRNSLESMNLLHSRCPSSRLQCESCLWSVVRRRNSRTDSRPSSSSKERTGEKINSIFTPSILTHCERWLLTERDEVNPWKCRKFKGGKKPFVTFTINKPVYLYGYTLIVFDTKKMRNFNVRIFRRDEDNDATRQEEGIPSWNCTRRERILDSSFVRLTFELQHPLLMPSGTHCSLFYSNGKSSGVLPIVASSQKKFFLDCAVVTLLSEEVYGLSCVFLYPEFC